jgi:very-short-patch-repair endonuclease
MATRNNLGQFVKGHPKVGNCGAHKGSHNSPETEFKKGQRPSPKTEFKKGCTPHNKGTGKKYGIKLTCKTCREEYIRTKSKGVIYCSTKCKTEDYKNKGQFSRMGTISVSKQGNGRESSIEVKLYNELERRGLLFEKQYVVDNRFVVDAYVPSLNLMIEADGKYWHGLPHNIERDRKKDKYLKSKEYKILRIPEDVINNELELQSIGVE